jgi:hypothetical protein
MNTRSRKRQQNRQESDSKTLNGSIVTPPDSPTDSVHSTPQSNGRRSTRQANGNKAAPKVPETPSRRGAAIYRVPINTWNMVVRKWEIPRKTLHVSIGNLS